MNVLGPLIVAGLVVTLVSWGLRILNRFQSRKIVEKLLKNTEKRDPWALENAKYGSLMGDAAGFTVKTPNGQSATLSWDDVEEIYAFKRDLIATDLICLTLKKLGKEEYFEIHEEMAGYHDLLEEMQKRLPKFDLNWFCDVAFPAFETKHQVIWRRASRESLAEASPVVRG